MKFVKTYNIPALSCHDCANHVIENLVKFSFIEEVHIDFDNSNITLTCNKEISDEQALDIINDILVDHHCKDHSFGHLHHVMTEVFGIDVGCDICAKEVEEELNKEKDIIDAEVNYEKKKVIIKHLNNVEIYDIVSKTVSHVEHDASIYDVNTVHEDTAKCEHNHHEHHHHDHDHDECGCDHHEGHHHHIGCDCCGDDDEEERELTIYEKIIFVIGVLLYVASSILFFINGGDDGISYLSINFFMFLASYFLIGYDIVIKSVKGILHGHVFNENFLMVIASVGSLIILEPFEATMVMLLYKIGEALQDRATERSQRAIMSLYDLKSEYVTMKSGESRNVRDVEIGDVITIKVGEKIPLDGVVESGGTNVDMKALTGESRPVYISSGEEILSGSINLTKVVNVEVTKLDSDSTVSKMLKLVDEASSQKAKTEKFISRFAKVYTPIVLILALIVGLVKGFIFKEDASGFLNDIFSILVISCPCALVISIPLGYFAGIGRLSSLGILVKGGNFLEVLAKLDTIVFDKTGTITKGNFVVDCVMPEEGHTKEEVLEIIAEAEYYSTHPIAESIKNAYQKISSDGIRKSATYNIEEISGLGLNVTKMISDDNIEHILVGNSGLLDKFHIEYTKNEEVGTIVYLAVNNKYYGSVVIRDEIKDSSILAISKLNEKYHTVMITGDSDDVARSVSSTVGIKEYKAGLLPKMKYDYLKEIIDEKKNSVCYVGDGINDAPVLRLSDVGIAMGCVGSDSAKEAADIVIMNDDLNKIDDAIRISKFTRKIVIENIIFALTFKVFALIMSILGILGSYMMILAVFADVGVCLLAILNSLRILKKK